jgi:hypothetical protein
VPEAERGFRKIAAYRAMAILVPALRARDARSDREATVEVAEKAA